MVISTSGQTVFISLAQLIKHKGINPKDVEELIFGVGGDHRQGAFRLIFKMIVKLKNSNWYEQMCGGAARIMCSKERAKIIKKAFLPQFTKDLKTISESKDLITPLNKDRTGPIVCEILGKGDDEYDCPVFVKQHAHVVESIDMYNVGDLKWLCMILGITNMEGIQCIDCYL